MSRSDTRTAVVAATGVAVLVAAATAAAWLLTAGTLPAALSAVRAAADIAAAMTLGLSLVGRLELPRYRAELTGRAAVPLLVSAVAWLLAELARLVLAAAEAAALPVAGLRVGTLIEYVTHTVSGRTAVFALTTAAVAVALAVLRRSDPVVTVLIAGIAAAGISTRAVAGHLSLSLLGSVSVVVHALAASLWFGTLAALALTVSHRGQWARVLPAFSRLALPVVTVLVVAGSIAALTVVDSIGELTGTGYGRVLLVKVVLTSMLLVLTTRYRRGWLRAAQAHRISATDSLRRSAVELGLLTAVLGLAAALTLSG